MSARRALVAIALGGLVVAGCSIGRSEMAQDARSDLVGMSATQLRACAGQPRTLIRENDGEVWIYEAGTPDLDRAVGRQPNRIQQITGTTQPRYCKATFQLKRGVVTHIGYRGDTGGLMTQGEACAPIVDGCMAGR